MPENGRADAADVNATALHQEVIDAVEKYASTLARSALEEEAQRQQHSARQILNGRREPPGRHVCQESLRLRSFEPEKEPMTTGIWIALKENVYLRQRAQVAINSQQNVEAQ